MEQKFLRIRYPNVRRVDKKNDTKKEEKEISEIKNNLQSCHVK